MKKLGLKILVFGFEMRVWEEREKRIEKMKEKIGVWGEKRKEIEKVLKVDVMQEVGVFVRLLRRLRKRRLRIRNPWKLRVIEIW